MPTDIKYETYGNGEVILFLHGWGQNKNTMIPLIDELKKKYKCIVIDMPGFGESKFNESKNIGEYTDKIHLFLEEKQLFPKYIVGHSFGGKIAIEYYLKYKGLKKIVLIASPILKPTRNIKYYIKIYKYKLLKKVIKREKLGSEDYKACPSNMKKFFVNVVNTHYDKDVKNIAVPILLLWGEKDKAVPLKKGKKLNKLIPNSNLYIIKGGHFAYLENLQFTKLIIQKFLRR